MDLEQRLLDMRLILFLRRSDGWWDKNQLGSLCRQLRLF